MEQIDDRDTLVKAFDTFIRSTQTMEEAYRRLESRIHELDRELESKNQALALAGDYLTSVLESMSDGVIAIDTGGLITTFNEAASEVLGYGSERPIGQSFRALFQREFANDVDDTATE